MSGREEIDHKQREYLIQGIYNTEDILAQYSAESSVVHPSVQSAT
jgi:hypothetical protein